MELAGIGWAVIRRNPHPDQQDRGPRLLRREHDGFEVATDVGDRQATQAIVAAQFDDDDRRSMRGQGPGQPGQGAAGRLAARTGIDDMVTVPFGAQPSLQQGHPALFDPDSVPRTEAVAQDQDRGAGTGASVARAAPASPMASTTQNRTRMTRVNRRL